MSPRDKQHFSWFKGSVTTTAGKHPWSLTATTVLFSTAFSSYLTFNNI